MSQQRVPRWDLDDEPLSPKFYMPSNSTSNSDVAPKKTYEVAELTWENGQLSFHALGLPRVPCKPGTTAAATITGATANACHGKYPWDKPRANGTLESIVNQATRLPHHGKQPFAAGSKADELVPWIHEHPKAAATSRALPSARMTMDAMVPCSNRTNGDRSINIIDPIHDLDTRVVSAHVESCSEATTHDEDYVLLASKRAKVARLPMQELSSRDQSVSTSGGTFGMDKSQHKSMNTHEKELGSLVFTSTSMGSPENTNSGKQGNKANTSDDHDSVCHSRLQEKYEKEKNKGKSSVSTRRSRAAAIHNQSERKRRDKINQRMKTLQKLVPNSSKTDKASMLDEVIEYLKQLQAQLQMMSRMNMPPIMMPMTMQQQFQMSSMMASTAMGLGMVGMGMGSGMGGFDVNAVTRPTIHGGIPPMLHPSLFMPIPTWDASTDHHRLLQTPATPLPADPLSTFLACHPQAMTMDQYSKMATLYHQMQQPPAANSKG